MNRPAGTTRRWSDCPECAAYFEANGDALVFAAASVGIERGLTSNQALASYFADFHRTGHKIEADQ